jgi:lipoic acid synthetase
MSRLRVRWLGRLAYGEAWDLQRAIHEGRVTGRTGDDYLLLLEHPPVYTVGRNADRSNLLVAAEHMEDADVIDVDRGGDVTFHGPGQLVGYPIVSLKPRPDVVGHVGWMEQAVVAALGDLGISAWTEAGFTGVWTERGKVAAIGVRMARMVTMHGFAVNCTTDAGWFARINPCGIVDRPVTTVSELAGRRVSIEEMVDLLVPHLGARYDEVEEQRAAFTRGAGRTERRAFEVDRLVAAGTFTPGSAPSIPVTNDGLLPGEPRKPEWMKVRLSLGEGYRDLKGLMRGLELHTVCEAAGCPNIYECWASGTATFMLLGDVCTRACSFCDVSTGRPGEIDAGEPARVAEAVAALGARHAVLTSVNRDDLPDGGAAVFAESIRRIRDAAPGCEVEVLIPDFKGDAGALEVVVGEKPEVLNHNTETVLRLQRDVRTAASYGRSLALLARARWLNPTGAVKSGLIVGLGETKAEVIAALADLRAVGVDIVTIGQYLRPTAGHRPVQRYVHPEEFAEYKQTGEALGIPHVESGPLVRSSYHAKEAVAAIAR